MTEATTRTCEACGGSGYLEVRHSDRFCPKCEGTGIEPAMLSPESAAIVTEEEQAVDYLAHCESTVEEQSATIAAQAEEIERLKALGYDTTIAILRGDIEELTLQRDTAIKAREEAKLQLHAAKQGGPSGEFMAQLHTLTADRDQLRLRVETLTNERFEAQDRYAAVEAERDSLREKLDNAQPTLECTREGRDDFEHRWHEAKARAEKYLAVITALRAEIDAKSAAADAEIATVIAMAKAGLLE